jgi:flagellar hook-basal body complex protein FliE
MAINNDAGISEILSQMRSMAVSAQGNVQPANASTSEVPDFSSMLKNSIDKVNDAQMQAGEMSTAFQQGDANVDVVEVMLQMQKASISFQAMVQVRNRLVSAYQDVMNMPV